MGAKRAPRQAFEPVEATPPPFRLFANLGRLEYVTRGAGRDLVIVGRYGAREICITVPGSEVTNLAAQIGRPLTQRRPRQRDTEGQLELPLESGCDAQEQNAAP